MFYSPANRRYNQAPTIMEIVDVIGKADERISYFDAGNTLSKVIEWVNCDPSFFNIISFARYLPTVPNTETLIVSPTCILKEATT